MRWWSWSLLIHTVTFISGTKYVYATTYSTWTSRPTLAHGLRGPRSSFSLMSIGRKRAYVTPIKTRLFPLLFSPLALACAPIRRESGQVTSALLSYLVTNPCRLPCPYLLAPTLSPPPFRIRDLASPRNCPVPRVRGLKSPCSPSFLWEMGRGRGEREQQGRATWPCVPSMCVCARAGAHYDGGWGGDGPRSSQRRHTTTRATL